MLLLGLGVLLAPSALVLLIAACMFARTPYQYQSQGMRYPKLHG